MNHVVIGVHDVDLSLSAGQLNLVLVLDDAGHFVFQVLGINYHVEEEGSYASYVKECLDDRFKVGPA